MESSSHKIEAVVPELGRIYLKAERSSYLVGQTVSGRIYLELLDNNIADDVVLSFSGKEKIVVRFLPKVDKKLAPRKNYKKEIKEIIEITEPIYGSESQQDLQKGQYEFLFSFLLPVELPATFSQASTDLSASIRYKLRASLRNRTSMNPVLESKCSLVVRNNIVSINKDIASKAQSNLVTCYCCRWGVSVLKAQVEKQNYHPEEVVKVFISLDNSRGKKDIKKITLALRQKLKIKSFYTGNHAHHFDIATETIAGIPLGRNLDAREVSITLPPPETNYKLRELDSGFDKSPPLLNATTTGCKLSSSYYIDIRATPDGSCCGKGPHLKLHCAINSPEVALEKNWAPDNWHPNVMATRNIPLCSNPDYVSLASYNQGSNYNTLSNRNGMTSIPEEKDSLISSNKLR